MSMSWENIRRVRTYRGVLVLAMLGQVLWPSASAVAQNPGAGQNSPRPVVSYATRTDTTIPLRHMPQIPPGPAVLGTIFERPRKMLPNREGSSAPANFSDPVLQGPTAEVGAPTGGPNFPGIGNVNSVLPPDPSGDVGPNHYVQIVNLSYAIWNKSGLKLLGPSNVNTIWSGFGGPCQTTNDGDPIVLYDQLADRWLLSQFALPNYPQGPYYQCIAVSASPDPTGAWHRYEFLISNVKLNDYPKFGVWSDGYYLAINQYQCSVLTCSFAGQGAVAFERDKMLLGLPGATMVYFDLFSTNANLGGMLPSDVDGLTPPPLGAPNYFVEVDDDAWGYSPDQLQIWEFHVDWTTPVSASFTHTAAMNLPTAAFDSNLCNYFRNCITQRGTTAKVDAISDRLMYRLQYRNFGSHQTLVANHTVDVNGADRAGIRWYELRNTGSGWSIRQQGTYSPTSDHRWMGSMAMNGKGEIALGYSKSSSNWYPSVVATGRLAGDASGSMTVTELLLQSGTGYQTHSSGRWGDYSQMTVDPIDDCTFWYTQEYYSPAGIANWKTSINSFQLSACGSGNIPPTASFTFTCTGLACTFDGSGSTDSDGTITSYAWDFGDLSSGSGATPPPHTYSVAGTYSVVLKVTDDDLATGSQNKAVSVDSATSIHVGDLDGSAVLQKGNKWQAKVTITVHSNTHAPVGSATVTGYWTSGPNNTVTCVTNTSGQCIVSKGNLSSNIPSLSFGITNVTKAGVTYNPGSNHDPDGDSAGSTIIVKKP